MTNTFQNSDVRSSFAPRVTVGLLKPADLAGYRTGPVYILDLQAVRMYELPRTTS